MVRVRSERGNGAIHSRIEKHPERNTLYQNRQATEVERRCLWEDSLNVSGMDCVKQDHYCGRWEGAPTTSDIWQPRDSR